MKSNFGLLIVLLMLAGCVPQKSSTDNSHKRLYDFESAILHPEISVYHRSDETTEIHYSFQASELLFSRAHIDSSFSARLNFSGTLKEEIADSTHVIHDFELETRHVNEDEGTLNGSFSIPCNPGTIAILELKVQDLNRKTSGQIFVSIDKSSKFNAQNFLVTTEDGTPICTNQIAGGKAINILCERCEDAQVLIARNDEEINLPPPPFSDSRVELPDHNDGLKMQLPLMDKKMEIHVSSGFYFISQDPLGSEGMTLSVRGEFFPDVMTIEDMVKCLRYITSRTEYESMTEGSGTREAMENFWIECAGSKDKARQLIQAYYNRVREANLYFSHVIPGWKTDRGLIHIVFGNPKRIFRYPEKEVWLYGEEDNLNSLQFTFRNSSSRYSNNHLVLQRDHVYKSNWERAVTSWRNGRIYED